MTPFIAEVIGTMLLILLGNGVVANLVLSSSKGNGADWLTICFGWGMAVFVAVFVSQDVSGAHLNPAVTVGLALAGKFPWADVGTYVLAQCLGAALGSVLVWLTYRQQYEATKDRDGKLATFCTAPAVRGLLWNTITEIIGTFALVFPVLYLVGPEVAGAGLDGATIGLGSLGALPVGLLVLAIGISLGGPTGYAINPARDLIPRIMHGLLPISDKRDSDWSYAWVPIVGPFTGAAIAAGLFLMLS